MKHRLINCEFLNAGSFKVNVSNRAKLLYFMMIVSADDRGFVDSTKDLINALEKNDNELDKVERLELLENTYNTALNELIDKGYLYEFSDSHSNKVHLIRHWYFHNKYIKGLWTNYQGFLKMVHLENNEYTMGEKKPLKENKLNEINVNEINVNESVKEKNIKESDELTEDDFPFEVDLSQLGKE